MKKLLIIALATLSASLHAVPGGGLLKRIYSLPLFSKLHTSSDDDYSSSAESDISEVFSDRMSKDRFFADASADASCLALLDYRDQKLETIGFLSQIYRADVLFLSKNLITEYKHDAEAFPNLRQLHLRNNDLSKVTFDNANSMLVTLDVSNNENLNDIEGIQNLTNLRLLNIKGTSIDRKDLNYKMLSIRSQCTIIQ